MKRISEIVLIFCLAVSLMASSANNNGKSSLGQSQGFVLQSDTSVIRQLVKIDTFNLSILPPSSGVQYYRDGIVFLSSSKSEGKMLPGHISFGTIDAYYAVAEDLVLGNRTVFSPSASFPFPCEALTFSSDFKTMYFTKYLVTEGTEKIFQAKYSSENNNQGVWSVSEQPLDFCTGKSTYSHPTLSIDGKILIFASNRTGSLGGMDLFVTRNNGETWSAPVNLGEVINTKSNELFPNLDSENNLFFSSDGLQGQGGYDVFVCKFRGGVWEKPVNLMTPVNTRFDDVAFTVNRKDGKSAFYTVKQKSGKRSVQLYMVTLNSTNVQKNVSNLSRLFTGPGSSEIRLSETITAAAKDPEVNAKKEIAPAETKKEVNTINTPVKQADITKGKTGVAQKTQANAVETPVKKTITEPPSRIKSAQTKVEPAKVATTVTAEKKDGVVYRVQIISNSTTKGSYKITINGKSYSTFEYFYSGGYRTCVGEFSTLLSASELQGICRKSGYPQAFIVAFINNIRSTDPVLFK